MTTTATPETKAPLFGQEEKRIVLDPLWDNNPVAL